MIIYMILVEGKPQKIIAEKAGYLQSAVLKHINWRLKKA